MEENNIKMQLNNYIELQTELKISKSKSKEIKLKITNIENELKQYYQQISGVEHHPDSPVKVQQYMIFCIQKIREKMDKQQIRERCPDLITEEESGVKVVVQFDDNYKEDV
jgi:regulator of replication initiation timing